MMYTSPKFEPKKLQKARLNVYKMTSDSFQGWWSKMLSEQVLRKGLQRHKPCTQQWASLIDPSAENISKLTILRPIVLRQLTTGARAPF